MYLEVKLTSNKQASIVMIGTNGTQGHLNFLSAFGIVFLRTITPIETRTKANNVPILHNFIISCRGKSPAMIATIHPAIIVQSVGAL